MGVQTPHVRPHLYPFPSMCSRFPFRLADMGTDNRDWHREWWRKRTGYVERASFRMSEAERLRSLRSARLRKRVGMVVFFLLAFILYTRYR